MMKEDLMFILIQFQLKCTTGLHRIFSLFPCFLNLLQVFQRRMDGAWNFYRHWIEYEVGFGDLNREHWLGNEKIYKLTKKHDQKVKFHLKTADGEEAYANYDKFWIQAESDKYRLAIGEFEGATEGRLHNLLQI